MELSQTHLEHWLREEDPHRLEELWRTADAMREKTVGNEVHFRGLIEISSYCSRLCHYCGLRGERKIERYRMTDAEIFECAAKAKAYGYGTVVLQAGEDPGLDPNRIAKLVARIRESTGLAITLSLGEQPEAVFRLWKQAGANRYLLRIETTDSQLLSLIHPGEPHGSRKTNVSRLRTLGYQVGSGIMVGIPGQTYASVAKDLLWFREMDLDMVGIGPYLCHPDTPLATAPKAEDQVPNSELMANKAIALTRLLCPEANIPATTALASINKEQGRELALCRGANVVMPNLTPVKYRKLYEIYPNKACISETDEVCQACMTSRILAIGKVMGQGPGHRKGKS